MKTSARGLNFFAHKSRGPCRSGPEAEEHLALKLLAVAAARRAGWDCSTEARGASPSGEAWTADVLAQKGRHKIAIEVQLSSQTNEEILRRQERYRQSGVRCLWLVRQPGFPVSKDLPAACVSGDIATGFEARLSDQELFRCRLRKTVSIRNSPWSKGYHSRSVRYDRMLESKLPDANLRFRT
ncbi:hypothetical protein IVB21_15655 [Bradyrhizobium sp. 18]|nr:hypothetical protein [Bradyrhizobium sp. 18]